jgi:hypothetical protein
MAQDSTPRGTPDSDLERGRLAALAVKAAGGDAMAQTLAWIGTAFDATARDNSLRARAERLRELQRQPASHRPDRTVAIVCSLPGHIGGYFTGS